jgi:cold shock CspA family protein
MATESTTTTTTAMTTTTTNGRVKWFNNKAGYGFITVQDCETNEERDIFVHHSEIRVEQSQYKYLVQGEYVEFLIAPLARETRENDIHATVVRGVNGGKLMCETRTERTHTAPRHLQRSQSVQPSEQQPPPRQRERQPQPYSQQPQQQQPQRPQLSKDDQTDWMIVPRRRLTTVSGKRPQHYQQHQQPQGQQQHQQPQGQQQQHHQRRVPSIELQ